MAAFWVFIGLTIIFAVATVWLLLRRSVVPQSEVVTRAAQLRAFTPQATPSAVDFKEIADAIATVLDALGKLGAQLDKLGPVAMAGVFTVFFAILSAVMALSGSAH